MPSLKTVRVDDFTGGLNVRADAFHLAENELPSLSNMLIDPRGGVASRVGENRYNTTSIPCENVASGAILFPLRLLSWTFGSTRQLLIAGIRSNGAAVVFNWFDNASTVPGDPSFSRISKSLGGATDPGLNASMWTVWSGASPVVYIYNTRWNGTAVTNLTASGTGQWQESLASPSGTHMPSCWHVATHNDRMWCANTVENGTWFTNRVRFSHPLFPESWRSQDYIDVVKGDGQITALVPYKDALYVFKKNSIHAIYGYDTDTFQLSLVTDKIGVSGDPMVSVLDGVMYVSTPTAIWAFDGDGFTDVSEGIRPLLESYGYSLTVSGARRKLYCSGAEAGTSLTYDPSLNAWTRETYNVSGGYSGVLGDVVEHSTDGGPSKLFAIMAGDRTGWLHQLDVPGRTSDANGNFLSNFTTRWFDAGEISARKFWRRPDFVLTQQSLAADVTVEAYKDWDENSIKKSMTIAQLANGSPAGAELKRGTNIGVARSVALTFRGNNGRPWGVESISFKYQPRPIR